MHPLFEDPQISGIIVKPEIVAPWASRALLFSACRRKSPPLLAVWTTCVLNCTASCLKTHKQVYFVQANLVYVGVGSRANVAFADKDLRKAWWLKETELCIISLKVARCALLSSVYLPHLIQAVDLHFTYTSAPPQIRCVSPFCA